MTASLRGLTVGAVDSALAEFDAIGREAFLAEYHLAMPGVCTSSATGSAPTRRQSLAPRSAVWPFGRPFKVTTSPEE
jgi:hypothetical protein